MPVGESMEEQETRFEHDTMGSLAVPAAARYGAQTARAMANFPLSGWRVPTRVIAALALIKKAFAEAHGTLGELPAAVAEAIAEAAERVRRGEFAEHFPVDVFQTGSGTSTNMNVNEVVANVANERLQGAGVAERVHPNDHVNRGQSSNDVVPSAVRVATLLALREDLIPAVRAVVGELERLAFDHRATVTLGRTHLMDAVPTTYGRIFGGWARRLAEAVRGVEDASERLRALPLGGTAVGSGIGTDPEVVARVMDALVRATGLPLLRHGRPAAAIAGQDALVATADALAGVGRVLLAVANDLRLRGSGPTGGLAELLLPPVQPGSSIMPGKVNPVIPEAVAQVAIQVEGLAAACRGAAVLDQLDLSHATPLLGWNLATMIHLLANACATLASRCLSGLQVDVARARAAAARSPALATALARRIGYERAAEVAAAAQQGGEGVAAVAVRMGVLTAAEAEQLLDVDALAAVREE